MNEISTKEISSMEKVKNIFKDVYNQTEESRAVFLDEIRRLEARVTVLRENMPKPLNWITEFIEPIALLLVNELKVNHFKIIETNDIQKSIELIFFNSDDDLQLERERYKITLIPEDLENGIIYYKTGTTTDKDYKEGTIGALNNMKDKTAPLPLDETEEVVNIIRNL
ncbi:hypothetical protein WKH56_06940 [Priestia sp. SB1]|uniref:Uncharacterized protein n=1 Tax=Priestia aryabhattai TaxID=412384 RepID=A0AAX6NBP0_PRIAR|nr:hypothetical protein [Priestia aryabhattai]MDU9693282.1 hypothetical protein [Priestia aryabhattai]